MNRVVVRRHLELLVAQGLVKTARLPKGNREFDHYVVDQGGLAAAAALVTRFALAGEEQGKEVKGAVAGFMRWGRSPTVRG